VFQKLFSEFGDVGKSEAVATELSKTVSPLLIAKENPKLTMQQFDEMFDTTKVPENKAFTTLGNRSTFEKD
jgi:hypothetical protein